MFVLFKFLHISAMFAATSLAVGPIVVYYLIARTGDASALRTAMKFDQALERIAGGLYGLGVIFGLVAAASGGLDVRAPWLLTAALVILLTANNPFLSKSPGSDQGCDQFQQPQLPRKAEPRAGARTLERAPRPYHLGAGVRHGRQADALLAAVSRP